MHCWNSRMVQYCSYSRWSSQRGIKAAARKRKEQPLLLQPCVHVGFAEIIFFSRSKHSVACICCLLMHQHQNSAGANLHSYDQRLVFKTRLVSKCFVLATGWLFILSLSTESLHMRWVADQRWWCYMALVQKKNAKPLVLTLRGTKLSLSGTGRHSSCMINIPSQVWNSYWTQEFTCGCVCVWKNTRFVLFYKLLYPLVC